MRGSHSKITAKNEAEALAAFEQDQAARDDLIYRHLRQRQHLDIFRQSIREDFERQWRDLARDHHTFDPERRGPSQGPEP